MATSLDCMLCLLRQSLEAARFATPDVALQTTILEKTMRTTLDSGLDSDPPTLGTIVHRIVREVANDPDPYYAEKKRFNKLALSQMPQVRRWIEDASDKFGTIVRLAIAGNSIDFALGAIDDRLVDESIRKAIDQRLAGSMDALRAAIDSARTILYLTDNAGEIVYDRLLVELLASPAFNKDVTVATRGKPILNDALVEDAQEAGIDKIVPVIGNGGDGLGVLFDLTSPEFNERFAAADLVIAKGLANYETLGVGPTKITPKKIAFLFKAKCPFIAKRCGAKLGDLVVRIQ